jgi:hypothetical protein
MARDNVELHRRVTDLEAQDRERLSRIAWLKLEVQRFRDAVIDIATHVHINQHGGYCADHPFSDCNTWVCETAHKVLRGER